MRLRSTDLPRVLSVVSVVVGGVVGGVVGVGFGVLNVLIDMVVVGGRRPRSWRWRIPRGKGAFRRVGRVLPASDRSAYVEEWRRWLLDMREQGKPWYRRLAEWLSIVVLAAPYLAVALRLGRRKAVD